MAALLCATVSVKLADGLKCDGVDNLGLAEEKVKPKAPQRNRTPQRPTVSLAAPQNVTRFPRGRPPEHHRERLSSDLSVGNLPE